MSKLALVLLADVKAWVYKTPSAAASTTDNDTLLGQMIERCSQLSLNYMQRNSFALHTVSELRDTLGMPSVMLREWPVLTVSSVAVQGTALAKSINGQSGWSLEPWDGYAPGAPQMLTYIQGSFPRAPQALSVSYKAGYTILSEPHQIASGAVTVDAPQGPWLRDEGITLADGTTLVLVSGTPGQGQYKLDTTAGKYLFNAADEGKAVLVTYDYTPPDVQQAVIEWIAERYAYMQRIGESSKTAGGQVTVSYIVNDIPTFVRQALKQYMRVVPI